MASNRELSAEAHELAKTLGTTVRTWALNNRELQDLVDDLRRRVADQHGESTAEEQPIEEPPPPPPPAEQAPGAEPEPAAKDTGKEKKPKDAEEQYVIAPGTSLTSARGILGPGTKVSAKDFHGGQATFDALIKVGTVIKG